jgi:SAM-dependent methyltransferase
VSLYADRVRELVRRDRQPDQRQVNEQIVEAIGALESGLKEMERRLRGAVEAVGQRADARLGEVVASLNNRLANIDTRLEPLVSASQAIPYVADERYGTFRTPEAGLVYGYRDVAGGERTYRSFADLFRGPEERIRERQRPYLKLLTNSAPVLDVGCGRGEFLDLLREAGIPARGIDIDESMIEHCRAKGLEVELASADTALLKTEDGALGAIFSAQVIEHLPAKELMRFVERSRVKLRTGGLFVAETVNPHAGHALKAFWVDPTHQHPIFPEVALALCQQSGFPTAFVFHPCGSGDVERDRFNESEFAVVATAP